MKKKAPHHPATLPGVWGLPETDPRRCEYEQRERQWLRDHTGSDRTAAAYQAAMDTVACELGVRPQRHSFLEGPEWVETLEGIPARWSRSQILDYKKRVGQGQRVAWRRTYTDGRPAETVYQPVEDAREPKRVSPLKPGAPRKFTLVLGNWCREEIYKPIAEFLEAHPLTAPSTSPPLETVARPA